MSKFDKNQHLKSNKKVNPNDDWAWRKFNVSYEKLTDIYPISVTEDIRYVTNDLDEIPDVALILRKDSFSNKFSGRGFFLDDHYQYHYILKKSEADKLNDFLSKCDFDFYNPLTIHVFVEDNDGYYDYAAAHLYPHMLDTQEQDDDIAILTITFNDKTCYVCGKRTWEGDSYGNGICPVCGCFEFRLEDNLSIEEREILYQNALKKDPNFMVGNPLTLSWDNF